MSNCKKCNRSNCCCRKVNINTVINSDSAGRDGLSAYEIAVLEGKYSGSQEDFINWLKGEEGPQGIPGSPGVSVQDVEVNNDGNLIVTLSNEEEINAGYVKGDVGPEGDSAYQVALNNGFIGTEEEWLESLKGENGLPGPPGLPGQDGTAGKDGAIPEYRYATNGSFTSPPGIDQSARFPEGWVTSTPVGGPGVYVWESVALINSDDTLYSDWSVPKRVTGLPGANGQDGRSVNIIGQLNTYTELMLVPTEGLNPGDGYILLSDGLLYVWNGEYFPNEGDGLPFIGPQGPPGEDGSDGQDGSNGNGYEFSYYVANVGEPAPDINTDVGWSTTFPSSISNTQTLWGKLRVVLGSGGFGPWQGPIKLSGDDGQSIQGPSMAYRGDWSSIKQYSGNEYVVDVVKYIPNGRGYIARTDAGQIPLGTLPTDTDYWNEFTLDIDSIFTDFLFAYSGYIQNLVVGQVLTNANTNDPASDVPDTLLSSEGTAIGFNPTRAIDPTSDSSTFSRHGIRQYHPSGRISAYMGPVHNYEYTNSNGDTVLVDGWAIITFLDMEDSPISFHLDSSTQNGIQFAQDVAFTPVTLIRLSNIDVEDDPTDAQMYSWIGQSRSNCAWYNDSLGLSNYVGFFYEYAPHQVAYRKVQGSSVTYVTAPNTSAPTITDGWFIKSFYLAPPTPPVGGGLVYPFPRQGTMSLRKIKNGIEEPVSPSVAFHLSSSYPIDGARWVFNIRQGTIENPGPEIKSIDKLAQYKGTCSAGGVNTTLYSLTYGEESPEHS